MIGASTRTRGAAPASALMPPTFLAAILALALVLTLAWALPAGAQGVEDPAYLGFFPKPVKQGKLELKLYPDSQATGRVLVVSVGVPFPPGYVRNPKDISLFDSLGQEMPIHVKVLARWPEPVPNAGTIRVALIQFRDLLGTTVARKYQMRWGSPRKEDEPYDWPVDRGWVAPKDAPYPAGSVKDPPVLATLPPEWLSLCLLKGRMLPPNHRKRSDFYDKAMNYYYQGSLGRIDPKAGNKKKVDYLGSQAPWLYDRAMAYFVTYMRRGGIDPLRQAHWATQFYAHNIDQDGKFKLIKKEDVDVKYAYQECLALDYWFTGDPRLLSASRRSLRALETWDHHYTAQKNFWTERHLAFKLLGYTTAYELFGDRELLMKAVEVFESAYNLQFQPPASAPQGTGCFPHLAKAHGMHFDAWVCSPWMATLFVDAAMRYYLFTADPRVPRSIMALADFIIARGSYREQLHPSRPDVYTFPHYLINPNHPPIKTEVNRFDGLQHATDTAKVLAAAIYFARKQRLPVMTYEDAYKDLMRTGKRAWKEVEDMKLGQKLPPRPPWPPRKFNWWFRTTADMDWLVSQKGPK